MKTKAALTKSSKDLEVCENQKLELQDSLKSVKSELKNFENKYNQETTSLKDEIEENKKIVTLQTELKDRILKLKKKELCLVKILKLSLRNTVTK